MPIGRRSATHGIQSDDESGDHREDASGRDRDRQFTIVVGAVCEDAEPMQQAIKARHD